MKQLFNIFEYTAIVEKYNQKGCFSNDYIQQEAADLIIHNALFAECYEKNAFLFVKKEAGMRMYYYLNDLQEKADFSELSDIVIEILFRKDIPLQEVDYFLSCGFKQNLIRDQYCGVYKDMAMNVKFIGGVVIEPAKSLTAVKTACELFNSSFDKLSGDYIPEQAYSYLLQNGNIICAWDSSKQHFLGALHQIKEKNVNWISHVAVCPHARGKGVGKALVDAFVEWNKDGDKTRYMLWVQRQNEPAVRMYVKKGLKYLNKSTISLIK